MGRARSEILSAAARLIAEGGVAAVTMAAVARSAGVAKATVYNHVRDRDELLAAVLVEQWTTLQRHCADQSRGQRLGAAAGWLSESAVLGGLRHHDPDVIVSVAAVALADESVRDVVGTWIPEGRDVEAALRWLISFAVCPALSPVQP